jgi:hypothetical protein
MFGAALIQLLCCERVRALKTDPCTKTALASCTREKKSALSRSIMWCGATSVWEPHPTGSKTIDNFICTHENLNNVYPNVQYDFQCTAIFTITHNPCCFVGYPI